MELQTTGLAANPSRQASERAFFAYYRPDTVCHILRNVHQINVAAAALPTPPAPLSDCCPRLVLRHVLLQRFMHFFSVCDDVCCFRSKTSATVLSLATPQTQQNMPQCRATFLCPSSRPLSHSHTDAKQKIAKLNISRVFYLACCCCCCTCPSRLIVHRESELASDAVRASTRSQCLTHTHRHRRHWQQSVAIKVKCSISAAPSSSFPLGVPPCQMPSTQPAVALCPVPLQNGVSTTALLIWCTLPLPRSPTA